MTTVPNALARWHEIVAARDTSGLDALLADEVVFQSPAVHTPQVGKAVTKRYLEAALRVLNSDSFRYVGEWSGERSAVLEFETVIEGLQLNGVDMIHWNDAGRIVRFKVMVRPVKALLALMPLMAKELQAVEPGARAVGSAHGFVRILGEVSPNPVAGLLVLFQDDFVA